jgi:1,2-diacylglycerol 3-beta-galactosyltransferase
MVSFSYIYRLNHRDRKSVDKCFVPSDALYNIARQRNLQPTQITQYGLPIRKGFWMSSSSNANTTSMDNRKQEVRQKLGLDPTLPIVLVVGGGEGMGGIVDISKQLGYELGCHTKLKSQMIVICGKNQEAKRQLECVTNWGDNVDIQFQGFVTNMDEYMKASDVLVTKAGPGTIAEASICGLPCMMFSYL